ncbi:spore germination protein [Bacillus sp. M6-12]|uniref:spore germination protein n=1 Tax=Bacillus sp. M6-12 TaxID=2054166 RepID=UPI000C781A44|nr:spore germination protein [Bacillus sp. M6-12]PLS18250.1 spore germination protein [Bacillus sp. M6-12]
MGFFRKRYQKSHFTKENTKTQENVSLEKTLDQFRDCSDLVQNDLPELQVSYVYIENLVNPQKVKEYLADPFDTLKSPDVGLILNEKRYKKTTESKSLYKGILNGEAAIFFKDEAYLVNLFGPETRPMNESGTETVITGPHEAFNESAGQNISLVRRRIKSSHLKVYKITVGEVTLTDVYLLYLDNIANKGFVEQVKQRIESVRMDGILESTMLVQMIEENPYSFFPQFLTTERPDTVASKILEGKIAGITDGSPTAFIAPTSFFEFFNSPEDYYQRWALATFLRLLRYTAFFIAIFFTAFYVAVTTFHYEMIPRTLLYTLLESRSKVPFPPLIEALIMEITIELLREAGARLPTKIGQTIGIVGGIVIGQSAVQAGIASNILIIAVAISAIASFVIPNYIMSASIRLIRFGLILLAGIWGNLGIMFGLGLVLIHLTGIMNLGTSFLTPIAPISKSDLRDIVIRAPFSKLITRPSQSVATNRVRQKKKL